VIILLYPAVVVTDRRGVVTWAEFEVPDAPRRAIITWAEFETPDAPRRGVITWAEFETPDAPRRGVITWAEFETPDAPRRGVITWAEFETPDAPVAGRRAVITWAEFETPDAPVTVAGGDVVLERRAWLFGRRAIISWAVLEVPDVRVAAPPARKQPAPEPEPVPELVLRAPFTTPRAHKLTLEPVLWRRAVIGWAVLEVPNLTLDAAMRRVQRLERALSEAEDIIAAIAGEL